MFFDFGVKAFGVIGVEKVAELMNNNVFCAFGRNCGKGGVKGYKVFARHTASPAGGHFLKTDLRKGEGVFKERVIFQTELGKLLSELPEALFVFFFCNVGGKS